MPISVSQLNLVLTNYIVDNWTETPVTKPDTKGFDFTGSVPAGDSVYDTNGAFIEFNFHVVGRAPTAVGRDTGSRSLGVLEVEIFVPRGQGDQAITNLEQMLYTLLERKTIGTAQIRTADSTTRPYEYRGRLAKTLSFPVEFFSC